MVVAAESAGMSQAADAAVDASCLLAAKMTSTKEMRPWSTWKVVMKEACSQVKDLMAALAASGLTAALPSMKSLMAVTEGAS